MMKWTSDVWSASETGEDDSEVEDESVEEELAKPSNLELELAVWPAYHPLKHISLGLPLYGAPYSFQTFVSGKHLKGLNLICISHYFGKAYILH